jgi:malonyl CoA-acyl carrier protein transacylase/phosphopantetheinyl transferase
MAYWASELVVLVGTDRPRLLNRLSAVAGFLERCRDTRVTLRDIAFTLAADPPEGNQRLAIVATSLDDLQGKIQKAAKALADPERHRYQSRSGCYFTDRPIGGKLAYLFPGEGAQYPGMLADLAICFPVVRRWFDFWEGIYQGKRSFSTTASVFPPPTGVLEDVSKRLEKQLYSLEIGSESMFITTQAMFELLQALGLRPDAMLGHSSGENSALVASGMVRLGEQEQLREHILRLNQMYQEIESAGEIVTGCLLTVGAVSRDTVLQVVEQSAGRLHLALDNCWHQSVLFGPQEQMDEAVTRFRKEGGLCAYLPFDRAYHTPLFEPVARTIERFFEDVEFGTASIPVYSCVNAGLYPDEPHEMRSHAAVQWSSRVRFTETIKQLYSDGIRCFVEVGPSGNLTAFVNDILHDQEHLSISANNRNRTGLFQLQQLLGTLFVNGHTVNLDYLYAGRGACRVDIDETVTEPAIKAPYLANTLPYLRLDAGEIEILHSILHRGVPAKDAKDSGVSPAAESSIWYDGSLSAQPVPEAGSNREELLLQHFDLMQEFLAQQSSIFNVGMCQSGPDANEWQFIQRLLEQEPARVVAEFDLDVSWQRFLQEHILYSSTVSDLDPELHALPVVPLTVSLEMLAEVAGLLSTWPILVALENVRAYNWIALDEGSKTIRLIAEQLPGNEAIQRFHAAIYEGDTLLLEGDVEFAEESLDSEALLPPLQSEYAPIWQDHELYTTGMFHGPMYHSVRHLIAWDETGIDAELKATPVEGFFDTRSRPSFFINPVLMDAVGHLTAFWIAQSRGTDFSCFPSQIARIELVNPSEEKTEGYRLRGRLAFLDQQDQKGRYLVGDFDCLDTQGRALFRIQGWRDRYFDVPHSFYFGRTNPRDGWYGEDWSTIYPDLPDDFQVWCLPPFPAGFLEDAGAVWKRLLVYTLLSREEREIWRSLSTNPRRRSEWLMGRIALKEVARSWIAKHHGVLLYPADIIIRTDTAGKPYVEPGGLEEFGSPPQVSLSHAGGYSVTIAGPAHRPVGIDLETFGRVSLPDFIRGAFTGAECGYVESVPECEREEMALRMWCAKEAAAKSFGVGLNGRPTMLLVKDFREDGQSALVENQGKQVAVSIQRHDELIIAVANAREPSSGLMKIDKAITN